MKTSINHGFKSASIKISKPNNSKQTSNYSSLGLLVLYEWAIIGWTVATVFTIRDLILFIKILISHPFNFKTSRTDDKDLLCPFSLLFSK